MVKAIVVVKAFMRFALKIMFFLLLKKVQVGLTQKRLRLSTSTITKCTRQKFKIKVLENGADQSSRAMETTGKLFTFDNRFRLNGWLVTYIICLIWFFFNLRAQNFE